MEPFPVLVAIREDLARLEAAAALGPPLDGQAMAERYPLLPRRRTRLGSSRKHWSGGGQLAANERTSSLGELWIPQ
jgi:hypothetical protein